MSCPEIQQFPARGNCLNFLSCSMRELFRIMDGCIDRWTKRGCWADRPFNRNERTNLSVCSSSSIRRCRRAQFAQGVADSVSITADSVSITAFLWTNLTFTEEGVGKPFRK